MFSTLSKGNILYVLDRRDKVKWITASVEKVTPVCSNYSSQQYGQLPELRLDIVANLDGEQRTFQQVPSNNVIADFGEKSFVLSDNKDSLYNYTKKLLKDSEKIVADTPYHESLIPQYKDILNDLIPGSAGNDEVKDLKKELSDIKTQFAEMLSLLKAETNKQKE